MVSLAPSPETLGTPLPTEPQWVQYGGWGKNRCERRQNGQQAGWRGPSGLGETSTNINHRRLGVGEGHDSWIPLVDGRPESGSESSSRPKRGAPSWASPGQLLRHATLHPCPLVSTNAGRRSAPRREGPLSLSEGERFRGCGQGHRCRSRQAHGPWLTQGLPGAARACDTCSEYWW